MEKQPIESANRHLCMGRQCFEKTFMLWGYVHVYLESFSAVFYAGEQCHEIAQNQLFLRQG